MTTIITHARIWKNPPLLQTKAATAKCRRLEAVSEKGFNPFSAPKALIRLEAVSEKTFDPFLAPKALIRLVDHEYESHAILMMMNP